uniref:Selenocysteine lyase n=1 Tax=Sphenodon punctatus TaxID=8508 RepID=A0A8D0HHW3_SPHPU
PYISERRDSRLSLCRVYMDYNATTPLVPEVIQVVTEAMHKAWGNPSSSYTPGRKAKELITGARESLARMVGGRPQDIIFTSGGTEANNLVIHTAVRHFRESWVPGHMEPDDDHRGTAGAIPHFVTSSVEHDSVRLPLEQLMKEGMAETTFVLVSRVTGQAEVDDVIAAIRPTTCLVSIMLANNETGVIMPISELSQQIWILNQKRMASSLPRILVHTDAAQMIGKERVDVLDLGVDYLTIVGHKFYGPRIGALYVRGPGVTAPLHPMLFGGGQERNFLWEILCDTCVLALQAAELVNKHCEVYEAHMRNIRDYLEERLEAVFGKETLSTCPYLLSALSKPCFHCVVSRPSSILLSCGIPYNVAQNALRLSVGRDTTKEDVDRIVKDLEQAVVQLRQNSIS